jgi:hypothetical protein
MWKTQKNNLLCAYLEAYEDQKKHIERVLSAKDTTKSTVPPYYPKFLKLKVCKYHMEEEKNDQIRDENRILYLKIKDVIKKPSKYSKIFEPKKCPAFDKNKLLLKRIKYEINNYEENLRFYNRIENAHSFYSRDLFIKRNKNLEESSRILQKSIFDISPNLMFSSPERIKNEIEKYRNKRNNSAIPKSRKISHSVTSKNNNNKSINKNYTSCDNNTQIKEENNNKNNKSNNTEKKNEKNYNKINPRKANNNENSNNKKLSRNTTESKLSKKNQTNNNDKNKRSKSSLKRNESEINLLG